MLRYLRRQTRVIGAAPGTLPPETSFDPSNPMRGRATRYAIGGELETFDLGREDELPLPRPGETLWVDIIGNGDLEAIRRVAERYSIPPLVLEDALDVSQRPILIAEEDALFVAMRRVWIDEGGELRREHLAAWLSPGLVLTFQEADGDGWDPIRRRIEDANSNLRARGADYLWYRLIDANVDGFYLVLDRIAERVEAVEEDVFESLPDDVPQRLREIRKEAVILKRAAQPLGEAIDRLGEVERPLLTAETTRLFADVRDHAVQVAEVNEVMREAIGANLSTYLSLVGTQQNEVMRILTLVASLFIPLTFVAGIYGMNFENMPELRQPLGYPVVWVVMITIAISLLVYFRRKGWL